MTEDVMRLICPNCAAQYEVADTAIPEAGRDVQCSDCGHGWFQRRPAVPPQEALVAQAHPIAPPQPMPSRSPVVKTAPPQSDADVPVAVPTRKPLDEHVMTILREEALREAMARRADAARAAGQPVAAVPVPSAVTPYPAPEPEPTLPRPQTAPADDPVPDRTVARRNLLPGIEEINSTLVPGSSQQSDLPRPPTDPRPGFRTGFGLMAVLMALAATLYVMAPRITGLVPQSTDVVTAYVGTVDHLRRQLDATVTTAQMRVEAFLLSVE